jgi:hypothetical protein
MVALSGAARTGRAELSFDVLRGAWWWWVHPIEGATMF